MSFNPTYSITYLAGGQLQINDKPDYLSATVFLLMGAVPTIFFAYRMYKSSSFFPGWAILLFGCPFLFCGAKILTKGSLILDRTNNTANIHRPNWLWHDDFSIPLNSIHRAEIRSMRASDYIALILQNGDDLTFAVSNQANGKGQAVKAINDYIGYKD